MVRPGSRASDARHRPGRADDDGPRAARAVRLPAAARSCAAARRRRLDARRAVRAARGARRRGGARRLQRGRRGEAAGAAARARAGRAGGAGRAGRMDRRRSTARRSPVRSALVLPPGAAAAAQRAQASRGRAAQRTSPSARARPRAPEPDGDQQAVLDAADRGARGTAGARSGCCTASPARARPRSTCAPPRRRSQQGRGAIVLVPEIALTPQIVGRFIERFGETVAVLHSQLRPAERYAEWRRLREGEARVCVGPRSAVFAPIERPRPDRGRRGARRLLQARGRSALRRPRCRRRARAALRRGAAARQRHAAAGEHRAPVAVHGSPRRVDGRPLPGVEVLDMRGERTGCIRSPRRRSRDVRGARSKAIVLLNRRGWSNFLSCRSCGRVWSCPDCDVALVLHRAGGYLACHHCGHREPAPQPLRRLLLDLGRPPRRRHRAPGARAGGRARRRRLPGLPPDAESLGTRLARSERATGAATLARCCGASRRADAGC